MEKVKSETDLSLKEGFEARCYLIGMVGWFIAMFSFLFYAWSLRNHP